MIDIFVVAAARSPTNGRTSAIKAAPLILIALGLTIGNRANVWNIGAEGQYIVGALVRARASALRRSAVTGGFIMHADDAVRAWPAAWPGPRCRRFAARVLRVNEILSSLMLTYVALQVLSYLVGGPWKDPNGRNFPATAPLSAGPDRCRCCSRAPPCIWASRLR